MSKMMNTSWIIHVLVLLSAECSNGSVPIPNIDELNAVNMWSLEVKWAVSPDNIQEESDAIYEIHVGRTENFNIVHRKNISGKPVGVGDAFYTWTWTSELPLQCTDHSVRLRRIRSSFSSAWSPMKTNFGEQVWNTTKMFPRQQVLKEGSTVHFCCVLPNGTHITNIIFNNSQYPFFNIGEGVRAITVENLNATKAWGVNFRCQDSKKGDQKWLNYVTFPPQRPQNLSCKTKDLQNVICSWNHGRQPNSGAVVYGWNYTLLIENSGHDAVKCKISTCSFLAIPNLNEYNVTVVVSNNLGEERESLTFNITDRVFPAPDHLSVRPGVTDANVSWTVEGNFSRVQLMCQMQTKSGGNTVVNELKQHGLWLEQYFEGRLEQLQPSSQYSTQVRCAVSGKSWGEWTNSKTFTTYPLVKLDVWRRIRVHAVSRDVTVHWKTYFSGIQSNIQGYIVRWEHEEVRINADKTLAEFSIGPGTCNISVRAVIQAGFSIPSYIIIPSIEHREGILKRVDGSATGGFLLSWRDNVTATCGFTVDWCLMGSVPPCSLQWETVPVGRSSLFLKAEGFRMGCRYTFNVFGCSEDGHRLIETYTGYLEEQRPTQFPEICDSLKITSSSVTLEWSFHEDDPLQPGFITGYLVTVEEKGPGSSIQNSRNLSVDDPQNKSITVNNLQENWEYTFRLGARTSVGLGPQTSRTLRTAMNYSLLLTKVFTPLLLLLCCCCFLWSCRKMLINAVMDIFSYPAGLNIKAFEVDSYIYEVSEKIQGLKIEECSCCDIEVLDVKPDVAEMKLLMSPEDTDPSLISHEAGYCAQTPTDMWDDPASLRSRENSVYNQIYLSINEAMEEAQSSGSSMVGCDSNETEGPNQGSENMQVFNTSDYVTSVAILK